MDQRATNHSQGLGESAMHGSLLLDASDGLADAIQAEVAAALTGKLSGPRFRRTLEELADGLVRAVSDSLKVAAGKEIDRLLGEGLVKVPQAAEFLACGKDAIHRMCDEGLLPFVQFDSQRRIPLRALKKFAAEHLVD